jgi:hypothetical protein
MKQTLPREKMEKGEQTRNGETETERRQRRDDLLTYGELAARVLRERPDFPQPEDLAASDHVQK